MPKRNRIDIMEDILSILSSRRETKPTHLMYKANLSHTQMKSYLEELTKKNLIKKITDKKNNSHITITEHGRKLLEKIKEMKEFEDVFGLER